MIILSSNKSGWIQAKSGTDQQALDDMLQGMRTRGVKVRDTGGCGDKRMFRIN